MAQLARGVTVDGRQIRGLFLRDVLCPAKRLRGVNFAMGDVINSNAWRMIRGHSMPVAAWVWVQRATTRACRPSGLFPVPFAFMCVFEVLQRVQDDPEGSSSAFFSAVIIRSRQVTALTNA